MRVCALVTVVACAADPAPKLDDAASPPMVINTFANQMCACRDKTCADFVHVAFTAWGAEVARTSAADPDAGREVAARYTECMTKALAASRIDTTPELLAVSPPLGDALGGTYVVIKGLRFVAARSAEVWFGTRQGTVVRFAGDSELIVQAPGGIAGETVDVRVAFDPGGPAVLANAFTFKSP
jgi:hypothetical protein